MSKWKIKRNALVQSLFFGFAGINELIAAMLKAGENEYLLLGIAVLLVAAFAVLDPSERRNSVGAVWGAMAGHLFITAHILTTLFFHWAIVVLYVLELALCIYIWRKE